MFKVLIADDEELQRNALKIMLQDILKEKEIEIVGEASNGQEALNLYEKVNPDILLLDVKMPLIDGITLAEIIKSKNENKRIIMLTAYEEYYLMRKAINLGVNDYLLKPLSREELLISLNNQINYIKDKKEKIHNVSSTLYPALEYIDKNYKQNITLKQVADTCNLSIYYFSKLFKKEMGINFIYYLTEKKIKYAKKVLKTTNVSIINIARELGYYDCAYFTRVFKKMEKITPSQYRKNVV